MNSKNIYNMIRRFFPILMGSLLVLASCATKIDPQPDPAPVPGQGDCLLTVGFDSAVGTKVASQTLTNEKAIQNVQIFVFRAGDGGDKGVLEIAASAGFDTPLGVTEGTYSGITVKCSTGLREVWAVVNDSEDHTAGANAVRTKAEFLALTHALETSAPSKFLMLGRSNADQVDPAVLLTEGAVQVTVKVHRMAAAVVLEEVVNSFDSPAYQRAESFRLDAAYLINVPGRVKYDEAVPVEPSALDASDWYAKMAAETAGSRAAILYDDLGGAIVNYGSSNTVTHTFYCYPNNCAASEDASWSPRATVLVLEASIKYEAGWQKFYYPVTLTGGIQSNKKYAVRLTVHRPGSTDPNKPVTFNDVTPVVTVVDWETGQSYTPNI